MSFPPGNRAVPRLLFLLGVLFSLRASGIQWLAFEAARLHGAGWQAQGVRMQAAFTGPGALGLSLHIDRLTIDALHRTLKGVEVHCPKGRIDGGSVHCPDGKIHLPHPLLSRPMFHFAFDWEARFQRLRVRIRGLHLARGRLSANLEQTAKGWHLDLRSHGLDLPTLRRRLRPLTGAVMKGWRLSGRVTGRVQVWGKGGTPSRARWALEWLKGGLSHGASGTEGEALHLLWRGNARRGRRDWYGRQRLVLDAGALLTPYFYLDPEIAPVTLNGRFRLDQRLRGLRLEEVRYRHGDLLALDLAGGFGLRPFRIHDLKLNSGVIPVRPLYENYLQPTLAETLWESLKLKGAIKFGLSQSLKEGHHLTLEVRSVDLVDSPPEGIPRRFAVAGLDAYLDWRDKGGAAPSYLRWTQVRLLEKIPIGKAVIHVQLDPRGFHLRRSATVPVFDGSLVVDRLSYRAGEAREDMGRWRFQGVLTPISMERLSKALGWPPLAGKLSGVIPGITYENGVLQVHGTLLIRIFGGRVLVHNLRLADIFGDLPTLRADLDFHDIDLETLTRTFSFGRITGKLEGYVKGLYLENWRPVAFDARFVTPPGDRSRHRISQKAVDNISNLGGAGVSGALSRSFLRFFKEFNYDRLGIRCRLERGICHMDGVAPAENGYYLVIGKGIPQINIKGYTRETDWNRLVDQLVQISRSGAPTVQ